MEEPSVCIGERMEVGPTPIVVCLDPTDPTSCKTQKVGGYTYEYTFVEGLPEGTTDEVAIEKASTGSKITVYIEDDFSTRPESCNVAIGDRSCLKCSTEWCNTQSASGFPVGIKYDCTNINNGIASMDTCVPLEPFLYPFQLALGPAAVISDRIDVQNRKKYANRGQIPLGYIALGMLIFVLVVGFLSN